MRVKYLGIGVTAVAQWLIDGKALRTQDWYTFILVSMCFLIFSFLFLENRLALLLVVLSIYLHSSFPIQKTKSGQESSKSASEKKKTN